MNPLSKQEELNINGGLLLAPLLTRKIVITVIKNYFKSRFK